MISHNESGAMGLVINRPLAKGPISDLLKGIGAESEGASGEIILHYGGPVEPGKGSVLHSSDYVGKDTTIVDGGLAVRGMSRFCAPSPTGKARTGASLY